MSDLDADIIIGSETLQNMESLETIGNETDRVVFSIDMKDGKLISPFLPDDPYEAFTLLKNKIKKFIVLDISSVGTLSGNFSFLEKFIIPDAEIYYGGGIKKEDIEKLKKIGVGGVLIGTALHKGLL
jgi:phosphoribosylformimino-5-aminoimidazole carboxamide ribotide isomerase